MSKKPIRSLNFEVTLQELEKIVKKMESGDIPLEESLKSFEEGIKLARECQQALKEAELKVQVLMDKNGILETEPFVVEE